MDKIVPTSKISLKISCLSACNNDVEKAEKLYNFLASDLESLPEFDPERLSQLQQVKKGAEEIFGWINSHQDDIAKGISLINGLRAKTSQTIVSEISPIPKI